MALSCVGHDVLLARHGCGWMAVDLTVASNKEFSQMRSKHEAPLQN